MSKESLERIQARHLETEMRDSFIDYSMSVIVQRALPDVRDGLKPVHRRILYAMQEAGLTPTRAYRKSATVVGDVIGKYHPHGDGAVYDSLVRMAQEFSLRYPLVDGQGNFGSVDGDSAAAYRYTEARLTRFASTLLADIDKETVDFRPNFDDRLQEPTVLPSALPNLLVNGAQGIAVGMATNIPPHHLGEIVEACRILIDRPEASIDELISVVRGPDFPTGANILGKGGIHQAYHTGRGRIVMRGSSEIEEMGRGRERIVITEIPFLVNKTRLIEQIAHLVREKRVTDISDLRDESDRDGIRIVVELKTGAISQIVLNQLYNGTQLQTSFGVIMLSLVDGEPQVLDLKTMLMHFLEHRHEVVERRTRYELRLAREREHILEGLRKAVQNIDQVIRIIRGSAETETAKRELIKAFEFTERQATAILQMRLGRLTGLEIEKLERELREVRERCEYLDEIMGSRVRRMEVVREEMDEAASKFEDPRRTRILADDSDLTNEDLIAEEDMVITVSRAGYIKRIEADTYRAQRRGGRGIGGMMTREGDWVEHLFYASTHDYLMIFTQAGRVYWLKVYRIPMAGRTARGRPIVHLLPMSKDERIAALLRVREFSDDRFVVFATKNGVVKKTRLSEFRNVRSNGIWAVRVRDDDELIKAKITDGNNEVILATRSGLAIRFHETDTRNQGRFTHGVKGTNLGEGDEVVDMVVVREGGTLLTATEGGIGKRSEVADYRIQRRGGKGLINQKTSERSGPVIAAVEVEVDDELFLITRNGIVNRQRVGEIRVIGRNTAGVRLINLDDGDELVGIVRVTPDQNDGQDRETEE